MKASESTKPISYLKSHTSDAIGQVAESGRPMIITQNGYAKAILQDLKSYEETQESLALLKIIALSKKSATLAKPQKTASAFARVRRQANAFRKTANQHAR